MAAATRRLLLGVLLAAFVAHASTFVGPGPARRGASLCAKRTSPVAAASPSAAARHGVSRCAKRASPVAAASPSADARRAAVGTWEMLAGPFVGTTVTLVADGSVRYESASRLWRGDTWSPIGMAGTSVAISLVSTKSGDELRFEGELGEGGEPGSLALSGRVTRSAAQRRVSRWDFAKSLAWGEARGSEDKGSFVLLLRAREP